MKYQIVPVTGFMQNCTILWDEDSLEAVIVDPGGEAEKLISTIEKQGLKLTKVLLTHGHFDHVEPQLRCLNISLCLFMAHKKKIYSGLKVSQSKVKCLASKIVRTLCQTDG